MKKTLISAFFILLAMAFVGCKDEKKGWDYLYGYTNDDIIGTYHFSNVADAFESLTPSEYCYLCDDAEVTISSYQENSVKFTIKCPEEGYNQTFTGRPTYNEDDFLYDEIGSGLKVNQLRNEKRELFEQLEEYYELLKNALTLLPPQCILHRLTGDPPKSSVIAPLWTLDKKKVLNEIHSLLKEIIL